MGGGGGWIPLALPSEIVYFGAEGAFRKSLRVRQPKISQNGTKGDPLDRQGRIRERRRRPPLNPLVIVTTFCDTCRAILLLRLLLLLRA